MVSTVLGITHTCRGEPMKQGSVSSFWKAHTHTCTHSYVVFATENWRTPRKTFQTLLLKRKCNCNAFRRTLPHAGN